MTSVVDLAKLSDAVYSDKAKVEQWLRVGLPFTVQDSGFKSGLYQSMKTDDYALAIAGTEITDTDDLLSDIQLALARMPNQFRVARSAYFSASETTGGFSPLYLTGHSLGGGLASMLGKQFGNPLVTFNAPGMARAFADLENKEPGIAVASDDKRKVLHVCAFFDVVSRGTGKHLGLPGSVKRHYAGSVGVNTVIGGLLGTLVSAGNPVAGAAGAIAATALTAHGITRLIPVLEKKAEYAKALEWA